MLNIPARCSALRGGPEMVGPRSAWPISPSVVDVVLRDPPRQQQPQQDYGWPGETVSGPAARRPVTDAKKSCGGDLGETKTGEGIAVVRRGHIAVVRRDHQVFRRGSPGTDSLSVSVLQNSLNPLMLLGA